MLDAKGLEALAKKLGDDTSAVRVGVLSNGQHSSGISLVELAVIHEFGSPAANIPERSFIRASLTDSPEISRIMTALAKSIFEDINTHRQALEILGFQATAHVKNFVKQGPHLEPALKPATVKAKGSTRPLVDKGQLINSVSHQVVS